MCPEFTDLHLPFLCHQSCPGHGANFTSELSTKHFILCGWVAFDSHCPIVTFKAELFYKYLKSPILRFKTCFFLACSVPVVHLNMI